MIDTPEGTGRPRRRIGALDGWRGVAILFVLIDHCGESSSSRLLHGASRLGATGVGLFFALSGFLITTLLLREYDRSHAINLARFFTRRAFRILPPVLVFIATLLTVRSFSHIGITNEQLVASVLLFRNYIATDWYAGWYTAHFWSLNIEEHFYLFWPVLLPFTRRRVKLLIALALLDAVWRSISFRMQLDPNIWSPGRTDVRIDSLLWGCILAIALADTHWRQWFSKHLSGWLLSLLVGFDVLSNLALGSHYYSFYEPIILALTVVWPVIHDQSSLRKMLDWKPLVRLGDISYSLYIWQQLWLLSRYAPPIFPRLQRFPVNLVMSFACAIASYLVVEQPLIRLGHRLTRKFAGAAAAAPQLTQ